MPVREIIKEHPWKTLIGSISIGTIVFTIAGSVFTEVRYVSKDKFDEVTTRLHVLEEKVSELSKSK